MSAGRWVVHAACTAARAGEGVERAGTLGHRAVSGARGAWVGAGGLHRAGLTGRHRVAAVRAAAQAVGVHVGSDVYHSDDDRARVLAQLDAAFDAFRADVERSGVTSGAPPGRAQWWSVDVLPTIDEWRAFKRHEDASWITRFATDWTTYRDWLTRLKAMRSSARVQGIRLASPEPVALPETFLERGERGRGSAPETLWTVFKVILYAVVGVTGVVTLRSAWRDSRDQGAFTPR